MKKKERRVFSITTLSGIWPPRSHESWPHTESRGRKNHELFYNHHGSSLWREQELFMRGKRAHDARFLTRCKKSQDSIKLKKSFNTALWLMVELHYGLFCFMHPVSDQSRVSTFWPKLCDAASKPDFAFK